VHLDLYIAHNPTGIVGTRSSTPMIVCLVGLIVKIKKSGFLALTPGCQTLKLESALVENQTNLTFNVYLNLKLKVVTIENCSV